jgi:hypothetical protein
MSIFIIPNIPQIDINPASISLVSSGFSKMRQNGAFSIPRHLLPGLILLEPGKIEFLDLEFD